MKPCLRCLCEKHVRIRAGQHREYCIIQCKKCGWNMTALTFERAVAMWNGFMVWDLVSEKEKPR